MDKQWGHLSLVAGYASSSRSRSRRYNFSRGKGALGPSSKNAIKKERKQQLKAQGPPYSGKKKSRYKTAHMMEKDAARNYGREPAGPGHAIPQRRTVIGLET